MGIESVADLTTPKSLHLRDQSAPSADLDRESFMKLLVAELQHQDPMEPMQARETITQLSQLTSVEKLAGIEEGIIGVRAETAGLASTQIASFVGRTISADATTLMVANTGMAEGSFSLDNRASSVQVVLRDANGDAVRTLEYGDTFPGPHNFQWDGNDDSGTRVPPGRYSVEIAAKDDGGNPIPSSTVVSGVVTKVSYENGVPELMMGSTRVLLGDVTSIAQ